MEKSEVEKSVAYIVEKTRPEQDERDIATENLQRANNHVREIENSISPLQAQIEEYELKILDLISEGKGTATAEKKLAELRAELEKNENFLNKRADEYLKRKTNEQQSAVNRLSQAEGRAGDYVISQYFSERFNAAIATAFEIFWELEQVKKGVRITPGLQELFGASLIGSQVKLNSGEFCSTLATDLEKQKLFTQMVRVLGGKENEYTGDLMRGKHIHEAKLFAERKAKGDAEARKAAGNQKRSVSMKKHLADKQAKGTRLDGKPAGYVDVPVTEQKIREITREMIEAGVVNE